MGSKGVGRERVGARTFWEECVGWTGRIKSWGTRAAGGYRGDKVILLVCLHHTCEQFESGQLPEMVANDGGGGGVGVSKGRWEG